MERENIHCSHGETGTVDETSDTAVEFDEVQVVLLSLDLRGFFLRNIAERKDVLLTELSVVIESELCVHTTQGTMSTTAKT